MKHAVALLSLLVLAGCAAAPPAGPVATVSTVPVSPATVAPAVPPPAAAPPPLPLSRLICDVPGRRIALVDLGLPEGSRPRDLALGRSTVWVLLEPNVLVGIPRELPGTGVEYGTLDEVETIYGSPGDRWETLSVSPRDGTVWIASSAAGKLWRKPPVGRVRPVPVPQAKEGGFRDLVAGWDGLYVVPEVCGAASIWRLDTSGKVLGTALPRSPEEGCPVLDLESDWSGRAWAFFPKTGQAFTLSAGDRWAPAESGFAAPGPWPERAGPFRGWFFWATEPTGLGGEEETILVRRTAGDVRAFRESCDEGDRLVKAVGDSKGWAVLTRQSLVLGGFEAGSPVQSSAAD